MRPPEEEDRANKDRKNCKYEGESLGTKTKLSSM